MISFQSYSPTDGQDREAPVNHSYLGDAFLRNTQSQDIVGRLEVETLLDLCKRCDQDMYRDQGQDQSVHQVIQGRKGRQRYRCR